MKSSRIFPRYLVSKSIYWSNFVGSTYPTDQRKQVFGAGGTSLEFTWNLLLQAIFELEVNSDMKVQLRELYITGAKVGEVLLP